MGTRAVELIGEIETRLAELRQWIASSPPQPPSEPEYLRRWTRRMNLLLEFDSLGGRLPWLELNSLGRKHGYKTVSGFYGGHQPSLLQEIVDGRLMVVLTDAGREQARFVRNAIRQARGGVPSNSSLRLVASLARDQGNSG